MNQQRQPKGTENGGQFAPDVNPESTINLIPEKDETERTQSDESLELLAEETVNVMDTWFETRAEASDDWNEWSYADAVEFFGQIERLFAIRKESSAEMVARAKTKKGKTS